MRSIVKDKHLMQQEDQFNLSKEETPVRESHIVEEYHEQKTHNLHLAEVSRTFEEVQEEPMSCLLSERARSESQQVKSSEIQTLPQKKVKASMRPIVKDDHILQQKDAIPLFGPKFQAPIEEKIDVSTRNSSIEDCFEQKTSNLPSLKFSTTSTKNEAEQGSLILKKHVEGISQEIKSREIQPFGEEGLIASMISFGKDRNFTQQQATHQLLEEKNKVSTDKKIDTSSESYLVVERFEEKIYKPPSEEVSHTAREVGEVPVCFRRRKRDAGELRDLPSSDLQPLPVDKVKVSVRPIEKDKNFSQQKTRRLLPLLKETIDVSTKSLATEEWFEQKPSKLPSEEVSLTRGGVAGAPVCLIRKKDPRSNLQELTSSEIQTLHVNRIKVAMRPMVKDKHFMQQETRLSQSEQKVDVSTERYSEMELFEEKTMNPPSEEVLPTLQEVKEVPVCRVQRGYYGSKLQQLTMSDVETLREDKVKASIKPTLKDPYPLQKETILSLSEEKMDVLANSFAVEECSEQKAYHLPLDGVSPTPREVREVPVCFTQTEHNSSESTDEESPEIQALTEKTFDNSYSSWNKHVQRSKSATSDYSYAKSPNESRSRDFDYSYSTQTVSKVSKPSKSMSSDCTWEKKFEESVESAHTTSSRLSGESS